MRSAQPNNERAMTDEQKQQLTARLLDAWKNSPKLRLGQLIFCATGGDGDVLFSLEDTALVRLLEQWEPQA